MDHRWGYRLPVDIGVRLMHGRETLGVGRLRQVSISGAFVRTPVELPLLSRVRLRSSVSAADEWLDAYVARRGRSGYGLEWTELAPEALTPLLCGASVHFAPELVARLPEHEIAVMGMRHT